MPTIPIKESTDTFGHLDANVPFAIESAVVDGGGNLDVTIGDGRIAWGSTVFELSTGGTGTIVTEATIPAAADDYYVYIEFGAGTPVLNISTTLPSAAGAQVEVLGYVTTNATPVVTGITDLRTFLPTSRSFIGANGSAAAPTFTFAGDPNTGIFTSANDTVAFSTGGAQRASISSAAFNSTLPVRIEDGTAAAPTLGFSAATTTGLYRGVAGAVNVAVAGVQYLSVSAANTLVSSTQTFVQDGTAGLPSVSFQSNQNTGIYKGAVDTLSIATAGVRQWSVNSTGQLVSNNGPVILNALGTAAAPSYSFSGDVNTGMYRVAVNNLGFATAGTLAWSINPTQNLVNQAGAPLINAVGSAAAPTYTFAGDTDTGMYWAENIDAGTLDGVGFCSGGLSSWKMTRLGDKSLLYAGENNDYIQYDNVTERWGWFIQNAEEMRLDATLFLVPNVFTDTTTGGANVNVASNGRLRLSTSLRANKTDIAPLALDGIRALEPVTYSSAIPADDPSLTHVGLIAEDVEAALPSLVTYDGEGGLSSVAYDRVGVAALALAQDNARRLDAAGL